MLNVRRAGNRQHHRRTLQQPSERDLINAGAMRLSHWIERTPGFDSARAANRRPRKKTEILFFTISERVLPLSIVEIVAILNADNRHDFTRARDFLLRNF